jgi:hypothetical protein
MYEAIMTITVAIIAITIAIVIVIAYNAGGNLFVGIRKISLALHWNEKRFLDPFVETLDLASQEGTFYTPVVVLKWTSSELLKRKGLNHVI